MGPTTSTACLLQAACRKNGHFFYGWVSSLGILPLKAVNCDVCQSSPVYLASPRLRQLRRSFLFCSIFRLIWTINELTMRTGFARFPILSIVGTPHSGYPTIENRFDPVSISDRGADPGFLKHKEVIDAFCNVADRCGNCRLRILWMYDAARGWCWMWDRLVRNWRLR